MTNIAPLLLVFLRKNNFSTIIIANQRNQQIFSHALMCKVCLTASNRLWCRLSGSAKSLNSNEYLASEGFGFPASLNTPKHIFLNSP